MSITKMGEEKKSKSLNIENNHQEPEEPMRRRETYFKYPKWSSSDLKKITD